MPRTMSIMERIENMNGNTCFIPIPLRNESPLQYYISSPLLLHTPESDDTINLIATAHLFRSSTFKLAVASRIEFEFVYTITYFNHNYWALEMDSNGSLIYCIQSLSAFPLDKYWIRKLITSAWLSHNLHQVPPLSFQLFYF